MGIYDDDIPGRTYGKRVLACARVLVRVRAQGTVTRIINSVWRFERTGSSDQAFALFRLPVFSLSLSRSFHFLFQSPASETSLL